MDFKKMKKSLLFKIFIIFTSITLVAVSAMAYSNTKMIQDVAKDTAVYISMHKLNGDMNFLEYKISQEYGRLSLRNNELFTEEGVSINHDYFVVDYISEQLGVCAIIYTHTGSDYKRTSTSMRDDNGNRLVDTFLGTDNDAYPSLNAGRDYYGDVYVLGKHYYGEYKPILDGGRVIGALFIGIEMTVIDERVDRIAAEKLLSAVFQAVGVLAAIALITVFGIGRFTKPLSKVSDTLKDIAEGEGDLTQRIYVKARDEIGDLSMYFNETMDKIQHLVGKVKEEAEILSGIGDGLATNTNETAAAVNEITANIQSIKQRIINQSASVTQTKATMEQLVVNIKRLDTNVESQAASVTQSSAAIEEMLANINSVTQTLIKNGENVHSLTDASEVGHKGLQSVVNTTQEIEKESEQLLEINKVIQGISAQTNLLSMNAAIEAAHAGEAGKGFSVVAEEIRKLADGSGQQSKTINSVLKKIKEDIKSATTLSNDVLKKFDQVDDNVKTVADQEDNIRNAMEEQSEGSKQILEAISQLNDITQNVRSSSNEMLTGSTEVIRESENLEKITTEISHSMNEMSSGSEQINTAVHQVNELCIQNREQIKNLIDEISRFKIA